MSEDSQEATIVAYLSNELDEAGRLALEAWIAQSEDNRRLFQEARTLWENSGKKRTHDHFDTAAEWTRLMHRIEKEEAARQAAEQIPKRTVLLRVAASLLVVAVATSLYFFLKPSAEFEKVTKGEVASFYLPDSSRVWLNVHSRLSYTKAFHGQARRVYLEGEGYFKVTPNAQRPFEVVTNATTARVLGTSFNVREDAMHTTLSVVEGKVAFAAVAQPKSEVLVTPRESATFSVQGGTITKVKVPHARFASWREKNNPAYEQETHRVQAFLQHQHVWKKNPIRQTVIDGRVRNTASLATYKNIVLRVTFGETANAARITRLTLADAIKPGQTLDYERRLIDTFTATSFVRIEVERAEVVDDAP